MKVIKELLMDRSFLKTIGVTCVLIVINNYVHFTWGEAFLLGFGVTILII